jgi:hypothetical protein
MQVIQFNSIILTVTVAAAVAVVEVVKVEQKRGNS